ncbi:MAG: acyl-CoA dehydrogenase family protein [Micrococcales bacterium]|nr:acyl-CoA dehydrogenase family protein [Micrococcales bacterium]
MHRHLSEEDAAFKEKIREFFTTAIPEEIRTKAKEGRELTKEDIVTSQRILNEHGYAVPHWPVEYGGQDWTELQRHIWRDEMQAAGVPQPLPFNASMVGPVIAAFGSKELKDRFLPKTASLDIWWCQGFSEPDAGSDLAGLRTTAVKDGEDWIVNGQKTWTTLGQYADWIFALVRTNPEAPKKQQGISFLLIDMTTPGIEVRPIKLIDGGREVNEVFFDNVRVPGDQLVGEENAGWSYAKFLLGNERVGVAPVGMIKRWLAEAKEYAAQVKQGEGVVLDDPLVAARIAELEAEAMALELTVLRVAGNSKDGRPDPASSILKLRGSQLEQDTLELITDIAGPMSLMWSEADGGPVPVWATVSTPRYLNFRKASIYGGSNEVQRGIISGTILGLKG